jgi:hypothetical protein
MRFRVHAATTNIRALALAPSNLHRDIDQRIACRSTACERWGGWLHSSYYRWFGAGSLLRVDYVGNPLDCWQQDTRTALAKEEAYRS